MSSNLAHDAQFDAAARPAVGLTSQNSELNTRHSILNTQNSNRVQAALIVAAVCAVLSGACSASKETPPASGSHTLAPPEGLVVAASAEARVFSDGRSRSSKRIREAFDTLTAAVEDQGAGPQKLANVYGQVGNLLLALKELETAEAYYLNAQTLASDDRRWPYLLGYLYRIKGPLDRAVASFERAQQLQPDHVATLVRLGDAYMALGRPEDAAPLFDKAIALDPGSAAAWFGAGQVALARNDDRGAVKALEEALARDEGASAIHYPLAMAHRRLGNVKQAQAHLARQGGVEPQPADPLVSGDRRAD